MSSSIPAVFISYRRSVSWAFARLVFNDLRMHGFDVFMDVESINAGEFETVILNQIAARAHFVVVLAPGSAERLTNPGDWLRREIEFGMDLGRNIIPLLVNGFRFEDFGEYFWVQRDMRGCCTFLLLKIWVGFDGWVLVFCCW